MQCTFLKYEHFSSLSIIDPVEHLSTMLLKRKKKNLIIKNGCEFMILWSTTSKAKINIFMYWLHDMLIFILVFQKVKLVAIIEFSGLNQVFGSFLIFSIFKTLEKVYIKTDGRVHSESQCLALAKIFQTEKFWKIFLEFVIICQRQLRGFSWSKGMRSQ